LFYNSKRQSRKHQKRYTLPWGIETLAIVFPFKSLKMGRCLTEFYSGKGGIIEDVNKGHWGKKN
jgi:hypothetical protein